MARAGSVTPPEVRAKISAALKGRRHTEQEKRNIQNAGLRNSRVHHASRPATTRDLEWAAGFLEGEGSFKGHGTSSTVTAAQVNPEPLIRLLEAFGGTVYRYKHRDDNNGKWSPYWQWRATGTRARGIALTLYVLLSRKRQVQIEALMHGAP